MPDDRKPPRRPSRFGDAPRGDRSGSRIERPFRGAGDESGARGGRGEREDRGIRTERSESRNRDERGDRHGSDARPNRERGYGERGPREGAPARAFPRDDAGARPRTGAPSRARIDTRMSDRERDDTPFKREREQVWRNPAAGDAKPMFGPKRTVRRSNEETANTGSERAPRAHRDRDDRGRNIERERAPRADGDRARDEGARRAPPRREHFSEERPARGFRVRDSDAAPRARGVAPTESEDNGETMDSIPRYRDQEDRWYGVNACRAVFAKRPQDIRKVFLDRHQIDPWREVLAFCAEQRVGYTLVEREELARITGSEHHEGVCFAVSHRAPVGFADWLAEFDRAKPSSAVLLWLDGVANPHNLGAILRAAAHFGALAVLHGGDTAFALPPSAVRIAEGAAEHLPLIGVGSGAETLAQLRQREFSIASSVVRGGVDLYQARLPKRLVFTLGAEGDGLSATRIAECDLHLRIPGSGLVESLNVAHATSVLLSEWWRQRHHV